MYFSRIFLLLLLLCHVGKLMMVFIQPLITILTDSDDIKVMVASGICVVVWHVKMKVVCLLSPLLKCFFLFKKKKDVLHHMKTVIGSKLWW